MFWRQLNQIYNALHSNVQFINTAILELMRHKEKTLFTHIKRFYQKELIKLNIKLDFVSELTFKYMQGIKILFDIGLNFTVS